MPRYTVHYQAVLESSMLIDAQDEDAAVNAVERWVKGGQNLARPTSCGIVGVVEHDEDPNGDW